MRNKAGKLKRGPTALIPCQSGNTGEEVVMLLRWSQVAASKWELCGLNMWTANNYCLSPASSCLRKYRNPYWNRWRRFSNIRKWMCRTFWKLIVLQQWPDWPKQKSSHTHSLQLPTQIFLHTSPPTDSPWLLRTANSECFTAHRNQPFVWGMQHALFRGLRPCVQREASYWPNVVL